MEKHLKRFQIIYIDNVKYIVTKMIEYRKYSWIWQEYEIIDEHNKSKWLCVKEDKDGKIKYLMYESYFCNIDKNDVCLDIENCEYKMQEKDIVTVRNYFGDVDVDLYDSCEYVEYISKDQKHVILVEYWKKTVKKCKGEYINSSRVRITEEFDIKKLKKAERFMKSIKIEKMFAYGIYALLTLGMIVIVCQGLYLDWISNDGGVLYHHITDFRTFRLLGLLFNSLKIIL